MASIRQVVHGVRALFRPRDRDGDVRDEVDQYLEAARDAYLAEGMSRSEAMRAARRQVGNLTGLRETLRSSGWEHHVETLLRDLRYAARGLRTTPAFAIAAVITLAIGIGASTAVFSAVAPILVEPLPFPAPSRLVSLMDRNAVGDPSPPTLGSYQEVRDRARDFAMMAAADDWQPVLTGSGEPERVDGQRVTANFFSTLGVTPLLGRTFTPDEDRPGGPHLVVLSAGLWQRRFGGARDIIGRSIELGGNALYVVIGVLPPTYASLLAPQAEIWTAMQETATGDFSSRAWGHHYQIVARLAPGATVAGANRELLGIGRAAEAAWPRPRWADLSQGLSVTPLQRRVTAAVRPALYAIIGAVALLLLIASVNVTNLLLARGARRRRELAMRLALGAGRARLLRQLLTESVLLALSGGLLGLGVAQIGLVALLAAAPGDLPRADAIHLDLRAYLFALVLTALVGLAVGLVPALRALRADVTDGLRPGTSRATAGRDAVRGVLVIVEVALAFTLLVSGGLLYRSVRRLLSVPPGIDPAQVMTMQVILPSGEFNSDTARLLFLKRAVDAVAAVPGVNSAGLTSQLPLSGEVDGYGYEWQSIPATADGEDGSALRYAVSPGYFATMRIPLVRGRLIDRSDVAGTPEAIVINASLARRLFGDRDPIGERVRFGPEMGSGHGWDQVVGVVGDVKQYGLAVAAPDAFYVAQGQWDWVDNTVTLVVRTRGDPAALVPALKRAVWSANPTVPIQRIESMSAFVAASAGQRRFVLLAIEVFAATALVLAAVGLYGVIAGGVAERIREFGIRNALGAGPGSITASVVRRALLLTGAGTLIGVIGALLASRVLAGMLFGVGRADPVTYAAAIATLGVVAMFSAWVPARRAAAVDPTTALRAE